MTLASVKEVAVGKDLYVVSRINGKVYCVSGKCTHYGAPLVKGVETEGRLVCPWHGASFDIVTGEVQHAPAWNNLLKFSSREVDGRVRVSVPQKQPEIAPKPFTTKRDVADKRAAVIIGAGPAGLAAAETLRYNGFTGQIVMLSMEPHVPVDRTSLSKGIGTPVEKLQLRPASFFQDGDIELRSGVTVTGVDTQKKLADGSSVPFDKLLIATGAVPRVPNVDNVKLPNIFTLRSPADSARIAAAAQKKEHQKVVVIGSSFIGMEAAAALTRQFKADVQVVAMEKEPFERVLGETVGSALRGLHEKNGVKFLMQRTVARFEGDAAGVKAVVLNTGERIPCDAVVIGAGVVPAVNFLGPAAKLPRHGDGSLAVDPYLSVATDVYAAGDVASFPYWLSGERVRVEHWNNAMEMGRAAARNMYGKEAKPFAPVPYFSSFQFGESVRYAGFAHGWDELLIQGDVPSRKFVAYYIKNDRVVAVASMGSDPACAAAQEALRLGVMPTPAELRSGAATTETIVKRLNAIPRKRGCGCSGGCKGCKGCKSTAEGQKPASA